MPGTSTSEMVQAALRMGARSYWLMGKEPVGPTTLDLGSAKITGHKTGSFSVIDAGVKDRRFIRKYLTDDCRISFGTNYQFTGMTSFSVSCWIRPSSTTAASNSTIIGTFHDDAGDLEGWRFYWNEADNNLGAQRYAGNAGETVTTPSSSAMVDVTSHAVLTFDGEKLRIYINGVIKDTMGGSSSISLISHAQNLVAGRRPDAAANGYTGLIGHMAMFDGHALTPEQVRHLYVVGAENTGLRPRRRIYAA